MPRRGRTSAKHRQGNPLVRIGEGIPLPLPVPNWSKPIIAGLLLLAIWLGIRSRLIFLRARRLERQRSVLLGDLEVMQAALVPAVPAHLGGLAVSVAYRPAEGPAAGGDFYDVFVPAPGKVAVILGDVSGHGREALDHAVLTRYTLRAYIQAGMEPRAALALAGATLSDPGGEHFATVAAGVYDSGLGELTFALAGHHPPIVRGFNGLEPVIDCSSPPIGWGMQTGLRQTIISLPAGSEVCFFSDGLVEARTQDGLLGRERLAGLLATLDPAPRGTDLLDRVQACSQSTPDDMAACLLAPEIGADRPCTWVEELEVGASAASDPRVRRFLAACEVPELEAKRALGRASEIAFTHGTALLRVERALSGLEVEVRPGAVPMLPAPPLPLGAEQMAGGAGRMAGAI